MNCPRLASLRKSIAIHEEQQRYWQHVAMDALLAGNFRRVNEAETRLAYVRKTIARLKENLS